MIRTTTLGLLGAAMLALPAAAQQGQTPDAASFATQAAASNQFEIDSSQLAVDKASSGKVKSFAREMIKDHTKAGKQFQAAAGKAGIQPPPEQEVQSQVQGKVAPLNSSGQFDQDYVQAQLQAHQDAVALFTAYSRNGDNPALKSFAAKTLPTLKHHLSQVEALSRQAGKSSSAD